MLNIVMLNTYIYVKSVPVRAPVLTLWKLQLNKMCMKWEDNTILYIHKEQLP
jgi:hypothetical protein